MVDNFFTPENKTFYDSGLYQSLRTEQQEIRLVSLLTNRQDHGKLELRLHDNVSLHNLPDKFFALSYAAGDYTKTEVVRVYNEDLQTFADFNTFSNLAQALRVFRELDIEESESARPPGSERLIWVDQICIDQSDPDERAHQVAHMRDIYQAAKTTIIHLGDDSHKGKVMRYLWSVVEYCHFKILSGMVARTHIGWMELFDQGSEWIVDHLRTLDDEEDSQAVCAMLDASWWERGWVCQEAVVSKDPVVVYGSSVMHFSVFTIAVVAFILTQEHLRLHPSDPSIDDPSRVRQNINSFVHHRHFAHLSFIATTWQSWHESRTPYIDIKKLLRHARECKTGDPRDRVFAFVGMVDPAYGLMPSYKRTTAETFANTTASIITKEKKLDIIFDAMRDHGGDHDDKQSLPDLPTWAANWSTPMTRGRCLYEDNHFNASADHQARPEMMFPNADSSGFCGKILRLQVLRIGKLSVFGCVSGAEQDPERVSVIQSNTTYRHWQRMAGLHGPEDNYKSYIGGGTLHDAFESTVLFRGVARAPGHDEDFPSNLVKHIEGEWSFFMTRDGYMGLGVSAARHDDDLCIALGASVPMILRRKGEGSCYTFVGEAYVHGLMNGEAINLMENGRLKLEQADIV
ncbi:Heterokaryon incompatibility protein (HET) domain containing protein [Rhypophila decipiens]